MTVSSEALTTKQSDLQPCSYIQAPLMPMSRLHVGVRVGVVMPPAFAVLHCFSNAHRTGALLMTLFKPSKEKEDQKKGAHPSCRSGLASGKRN